MKLKNRFQFCFFICILIACVQVSLGQKRPDDMLNRRLEPLAIEADSMAEILSKISGDYGIPIGQEAATDGQSPTLSVVIQGRSLRDVLDEIVKQDPRYEWKVIDGVINVFPRTKRDLLLANILDQRVQSFTIPKATRLIQIRYAIAAIPEVKELLQQANVTPMDYIAVGGDLVKPGQDFSLNTSDSTVREILNQIIRTSDFKYWIVNRYGKNNEFFIVNF